MTTIKANTKKGEIMLNNARTNQGTELYQIYSSYSTAKAKALEYCKALCNEENGYNFRIISHNSQTFSVAWETEQGTRIETAYNSYLIS